jgi:hypothetical protein
VRPVGNPASSRPPPAHNRPTPITKRVPAHVWDLLEVFGWLKNRAIGAVLLIGSTAEGIDDEASDLDVVLVSERIPSRRNRERAYAKAGCDRAMVDFLRGNAPILSSNVSAIDKVWFGGTQVDISYCLPPEVKVYSGQDCVVVKDSGMLGSLRRARKPDLKQVSRSSARLTYCYRILLVHRDRYARWCKRREWLLVDVSTFLSAARDMVMVLNGYKSYSSYSPALWRALENVRVKTERMWTLLTDIKALDDRVAFNEKLKRMDELIKDLEELCAARRISLTRSDI